jgi:hypothetical protein
MQERKYRRAVKIVSIVMLLIITFFVLLLALFIIKPDTSFSISKDTSFGRQVAFHEDPIKQEIASLVKDSNTEESTANKAGSRAVRQASAPKSSIASTDPLVDTPDTSVPVVVEYPGKEETVTREDDTYSLTIVDCAKSKLCRED